MTKRRGRGQKGKRKHDDIAESDPKSPPSPAEVCKGFLLCADCRLVLCSDLCGFIVKHCVSPGNYESSYCIHTYCVHTHRNQVMGCWINLKKRDEAPREGRHP